MKGYWSLLHFNFARFWGQLYTAFGQKRSLYLGFLARVKSWRSSCCDIAGCLCFPNTRGDTKGGRVPYWIIRTGFKYSGRAIRHGMIHARGCLIHPSRGREEGCGVYKADCPSCIPSRLLGILSPYPLHALSRWFLLSLSRLHHLSVSFSPAFLPSFVRRLSRRAIFIAFEYPAGGISRSDQDVAPMLP